MNKSDSLTNKEKRIIDRELKTIFSNKGVFLPITIEDFKNINFFSPRFNLNNKEVYFSKSGEESILRICDIVYNGGYYHELINYNDAYQNIISEIEKWFNADLELNVDEFMSGLNKRLNLIIKNYNFACKVSGIKFDGISSLLIGGKKLIIYDSDVINDKVVRDALKESINKDYFEKLIITGKENGSESVALEKFYHNSEIVLSLLRLYSCAIDGIAVNKIDIGLINNNTKLYGPSSCLCWDDIEDDLKFIRYFRKNQDFEINDELLNYLDECLFFKEFSSIIDKEERNELEDAIIKSIYWIGEAQKEHSNSSSWIKLWSALECYFTLGNNEITEKNARGISAILVFGGFKHPEYGDYGLVKNKIKKYYKLRSKVVHHAEYLHIDNKDMKDMAFMAAWVVINMVALTTSGYTKLSQISEQAERLDNIERKSLVEK